MSTSPRPQHSAADETSLAVEGLYCFQAHSRCPTLNLPKALIDMSTCFADDESEARGRLNDLPEITKAANGRDKLEPRPGCVYSPPHFHSPSPKPLQALAVN